MKRFHSVLIAASLFLGAGVRAQPPQDPPHAAIEPPAADEVTDAAPSGADASAPETETTLDPVLASPRTDDAPLDVPASNASTVPEPHASPTATPSAAATEPVRDAEPESGASLASPSAARAPRTRARPAALELAVGFDLISRHFRYSDDIYGFLRPYSLPGGGAIALDGRWFPGAHSAHGVASAFGVEIRYDRSFGIQSARGGLRFPTAMRIVETNLLARFARGGHEAIGVVGYGNQAFELARTTPSTPDNLAVPDVPSVAYAYVRVGAEGRVRVHERVSVLAGASYLFVFGAGGIASPVWFPRATAGGAAFVARVAVRVTKCLEAQAGLEYRRYFLDMHSRIGDPFIAGGALDQYTLADVRLVFRL